MVRLYRDENVRGAITRALRARELLILTAQEDGRDATPDPEVLDRSTELGYVLFTQDDDFLTEAARRQEQGIPFAGVIFAHQRRVPVSVCIRDLELIALAGELDEFRNRVEYLPL
jgi:predicted nuclease of predicted toxin-antitoxin system